MKILYGILYPSLLYRWTIFWVKRLVRFFVRILFFRFICSIVILNHLNWMGNLNSSFYAVVEIQSKIHTHTFQTPSTIVLIKVINRERKSPIQFFKFNICHVKYLSELYIYSVASIVRSLIQTIDEKWRKENKMFEQTSAWDLIVFVFFLTRVSTWKTNEIRGKKNK